MVSIPHPRPTGARSSLLTFKHSEHSAGRLSIKEIAPATERVLPILFAAIRPDRTVVHRGRPPDSGIAELRAP